MTLFAEQSIPGDATFATLIPDPAARITNPGNGIAATSGTTELDMPKYGLTCALTTGRYYVYKAVVTWVKSVSTDEFQLQLRANTALTGTQVGLFRLFANQSAWQQCAVEILFVGDASYTSLHLSVVRGPAAGTGTLTYYGTTGGFNRCWAELWDRGDSDNWIDATSNPSGQAMPSADLPNWQLVFSDDFTTDVALGSFPEAVSAKWDAYPYGWPDTSGNGTYAPHNVLSVSSGVLRINMHTEAGVHMVGAALPQLGGPGAEGGWTYQRLAVRWRATATVSTYKIAWLLWPDSEIWADGEIDFPEANLDAAIEAFAHHRGDPTSQDGYSTSTTMTDWHTAVVEWTPTYISFFLDGAVIGTSTDAAFIPDTPMHWVIQSETAIGGPAPADTDVGTLEIDWVAAWRWTG